MPSFQILREFANRLGVNAEYLATGHAEEVGLSSELLEAEVASKLGDLERAAKLYEEARDTADSPAALARAQLGLGQLAVRRGELSEGIGLLEQAFESGELAPADASIATNALGRSYCAAARYDEAFAAFERGLQEAQTRDDQFDQVRFAVSLANTYIDHGDYARAHATLGQVLDLARQTVDPMLRASLYWSQSRAYLSQADPDRAAEYANLTITTLKASEQTLEAARALLLLAFIENDRGNPEAALDLVAEAEPIVAAAGETTDAAMFAIERARALAALGEADDAAQLLLETIPRLRATAPRDAARAYAAAAGIFRRQGDTTRALELYEFAIEESPVMNRHTADALTAMAEIYEEQGNTTKALELLKQALAARNNIVA